MLTGARWAGVSRVTPEESVSSQVAAVNQHSLVPGRTFLKCRARVSSDGAGV